MLQRLRTFRPINLFIIALIFFLVRYCIIMPAFITEYQNTGVFPTHMTKPEFYILLFATLMIAAGGYVINDVFDIHIDEVNKPGKNVIGKSIPVESAKLTAYILFTIGSIAGIILSF